MRKTRSKYFKVVLFNGLSPNCPIYLKYVQYQGHCVGPVERVMSILDVSGKLNMLVHGQHLSSMLYFQNKLKALSCLEVF